MLTADLTVSKDHMVDDFSRDNPAVVTVRNGGPAVIRIESNDTAYRRLLAGESLDSISLEGFNPVSGPIAVEGAEPGDAICVRVLEIEIRRVWSIWIPCFGALGARTKRIRIKEVPVRDNCAKISESIVVPLQPMISYIGFAPSKGRSSTVAPVFPWGGNMDLRQAEPGAIVYLPVQVPQGLPSLGDLHACMGGGAPLSIALEASGSATIRVSVAKEMQLRRPLLRHEGRILFVGLGPTLELAQKDAVGEAWRWLTKVRRLGEFEAYTFCSAALETTFGGPASPVAVASLPDLASEIVIG